MKDIIQKIDFVVLWVDDSDEYWVRKKNEYRPKNETDAGSNRYRDWGLFKYWFRGVELYAPWVNRVYLVTDNQKPSWINVNHPKLRIINHQDYIDEKYLPLFNSNAIESRLDNIDGLSEHFVLFSDDVFIIKPVKPNDFFKNGLPRDIYIENPIIPDANDKVFNRTMMTATEIVNSNVEKRSFIKKNFTKIINPKYGVANLRNILALPSKKFEGFKNPHAAQPLLKSNFEKVRSKNKELYEKTLRNKFRAESDITQFSVRYEHLVHGNFVPRSYSFSKYFEIKSENLQTITKTIKKQKAHIVCLNDCSIDNDYVKAKQELLEAFDGLLGERCMFEKGE